MSPPDVEIDPLCVELPSCMFAECFFHQCLSCLFFLQCPTFLHCPRMAVRRALPIIDSTFKGSNHWNVVYRVHREIGPREPPFERCVIQDLSQRYKELWCIVRLVSQGQDRAWKKSVG